MISRHFYWYFYLCFYLNEIIVINDQISRIIGVKVVMCYLSTSEISLLVNKSQVKIDKVKNCFIIFPGTIECNKFDGGAFVSHFEIIIICMAKKSFGSVLKSRGGKTDSANVVITICCGSTLKMKVEQYAVVAAAAAAASAVSCCLLAAIFIIKTSSIQTFFTFITPS